jgi:hypothetical protein
VTGQDLDEGEDGVFRIARRVAKDRVIPAAGTEARHGHKTSARGSGGYKGHPGIDPDCELITATAVTPGNTGDAAAAAGLPAGDLPAGPADAGEPLTGPGREEEEEEEKKKKKKKRRRRSSVSTGMPPTAPASSPAPWSRAARTSTARCSRQSPRPAGSPRTPSTSTWPPAR